MTGLTDALRGRRQVAMPTAWPRALTRHQARRRCGHDRRGHGAGRDVWRCRRSRQHAQRLVALTSAPVDQRTERCRRALESARSRAGADVAIAARRCRAALGGTAGPGPVRRSAHAATIIDVYPRLNSLERRDALATLGSRVDYAQALLDAVAEKQIAAADLSADLVRQLHNLKNAALDEKINDAWGTVRDTAEDKAQAIVHYKQLISNRSRQRPDVSLGRAVFAKTCQQCHTLFGTGGKVGPELTGSNRANLDYVLSNVLDSSALVGKDYQATVITTTDGRVLTGIVRGEDNDAVTLATANETVVVPKGEIDERDAKPEIDDARRSVEAACGPRSSLARGVSGQSRAGALAGHGRQRGRTSSTAATWPAGKGTLNSGGSRMVEIVGHSDRAGTE